VTTATALKILISLASDTHAALFLLASYFSLPSLLKLFYQPLLFLLNYWFSKNSGYQTEGHNVSSIVIVSVEEK
jgi:hypothetical protein